MNSDNIINYQNSTPQEYFQGYYKQFATPQKFGLNFEECLQSNIWLFTDLITIKELSENDCSNCSNLNLQPPLQNSEEISEDKANLGKLPPIPQTIVPKQINFARKQ